MQIHPAGTLSIPSYPVTAVPPERSQLIAHMGAPQNVPLQYWPPSSMTLPDTHLEDPLGASAPGHQTHANLASSQPATTTRHTQSTQGTIPIQGHAFKTVKVRPFT